MKTNSKKCKNLFQFQTGRDLISFFMFRVGFFITYNKELILKMFATNSRVACFKSLLLGGKSFVPFPCLFLKIAIMTNWIDFSLHFTNFCYRNITVIHYRCGTIIIMTIGRTMPSSSTIAEKSCISPKIIAN